MRLQGKVATVTGGGSGIGRAACVLFAKEGAKVVVADVNETTGAETVQMIRSDGGEAMFVRTDVSDSASVKAMVERTVSAYGKLNIMFNNAGIVGPLGGPAEAEEAEWDAAMAVDLRGVYVCCRYGIPELIKNGGGSIINTSSIGAIVGGGPPMVGTISAYNTAKGGVVSLTHTVAYAYGHKGIRCNAILPGVIETPVTSFFVTLPKVQEALIESTPLRRVGQPEDVANVALFLASDESSFVSGASIVVDGAWTLSQGTTYPQIALG